MSDTTTKVEISEVRTPRGTGTVTISGDSREAVHEAAIERYKTLQQGWRDPTYPRTFEEGGRWVAVISYWGLE